jgi:1-deoxy-D-xylulose-5-phosphate reductoisomerase
VKAQLGVPDMKLPIQYALTYPERLASSYTRIDFAALKEMTFFPPDPKKFECLQLAYDALKEGGTAPTILNAANEVAVAKFLAGSAKFTDIPRIIRTTIERVPVKHSPTLEDIFSADKESRRFAQTL